MSYLRRWHIFLLTAALLATPAWGARSHRSATAHRHYRHHHRYYHHRYRHRYARHEMTAQRIRQIQAALVHKHYLTGKPNGRWDARTQAAMKKYQADHGWQTKLVPDARALIKLGLGPKVDEARLKNEKKAKQPKPDISYSDTLAAVQLVPK